VRAGGSGHARRRLRHGGRLDLHARFVSKTDELIAIAKNRRQTWRIYASHIRNEGSQLLESLDEDSQDWQQAQSAGACVAHQSQRPVELGPRARRDFPNSDRLATAASVSRLTNIRTRRVARRFPRR